MQTITERIRELKDAGLDADIQETSGPRNQLGQPATRTPEEAIARLQEKASESHGGANRERIQAQIAENSGPLAE